MAVSLVHSQQWAYGTPNAVTPSVTPTPGNLMILSCSTRNTGLGPVAISGWNLASPGVQAAGSAGKIRDHALFYRFAQAGDTSWTPTASSTTFQYAEFSGVGAFLSSVGQIAGGSTTNSCGGAISTSGPALIVGGEANNKGDTQTSTSVATSPTVEILDSGGTGSPGAWLAYRVEAAAGSYQPTGVITMSGGDPPAHIGITIAFDVDVPPTADFVADVTDGNVPTTVNFTDLSAGIPTSWLWDFGDGGTSTSQNPSHVYSAPGTYSVTLTATNAFGSDDETKAAYIFITVDVGYDPPAPGQAILEIYASSPGSAKWGQALWGQAVWGQAGWQDVTPQGIEVRLLWGSSEPERGILSRPSADSWAIRILDPDRILDPANADGPYFRDLIPYLPVRLSHRQKVIALGFAESIGHSYADNLENGYMRVTNNLSKLANAKVPSDIELSDTLYARAVDAIASAGLSISVGSALGTDPPLVPWADLDPVPEWSAWDWITDAAEQAHYIPIVNRRTGVVEFRAWSAPLHRGRSLDSPNLVDLQVISEYRGLYSVIQAQETVADGGNLAERALTPPPRYGARTFTRSDLTLDAGDWADVILADRGLPGLRWVPGLVYPLTADDVEEFATIEAVELVSMAVTEQSPPVSATGIIVGGSITVVGKKDSEAVWSFTFEAAQTATEPLIETGGDPTDYLLATGGDEFLYPTT